MMRIVMVLILLAPSAGCAGSSGPAEPAPAGRTTVAAPAATGSDQGALEASLLAADRAFAVATARGGLDAWVEVFTWDGRQFTGGEVVEGAAAIRELMAPAFSDPSFALHWEPEGAAVSDDGSLGYTWGRYESRLGGRSVGTGRYLTVWRRQPDGGWRVEADIGSPRPQAGG